MTARLLFTTLFDRHTRAAALLRVGAAGRCAMIAAVTEPAPTHDDPGVPDQIKVWFRFVPRQDWLPYDSEGLWATRSGADVATVDNVPFLQDGVAQGDLVRFSTDADGVHWATERVAASGSCTIRVLPMRDGPLGRVRKPCSSASRRSALAVSRSARSSHWSRLLYPPTPRWRRSRRCWFRVRSRGGGTTRWVVPPTRGEMRREQQPRGRQ